MLGSTLFEFVLMREEDDRILRNRRDEAKRIKLEKQIRLEKHEKKIKSSQMRKRGGDKGILSPSVSSEAVANIDD